MLKAGQLDRTIEILARNVVSSSISDAQVRSAAASSFTTVLSGWAKVDDISDEESLRDGKLATRRMKKFTIRYSRNIQQIHVVRYDSKIYEILELLELGRKEGLIIKARDMLINSYVITTGDE